MAGGCPALLRDRLASRGTIRSEASVRRGAVTAAQVAQDPFTPPPPHPQGCQAQISLSKIWLSEQTESKAKAPKQPTYLREPRKRQEDLGGLA